MEPILAKAEAALSAALEALKALPVDEHLARQEPNELKTIQELRPPGPRRIWDSLDSEQYKEKLAGAMLGRMAGCTWAAPVEFWPIERMEALAKETDNPFPPVDYWTYVPEPHNLRYNLSPVESYTRGKMDGVPVDDDLAYTLLGLFNAGGLWARFYD